MARPRSEEKYQAIMRATLKLVTDLGFHGLSMSKIAKEANIVPATIYIYFENKEAIVNQLYRDLKELIFKDMLKGRRPGMSTRQSLALIWKNIFHNILRYHLEFKFLEQFSNSPYITQISREEGGRHFRPLWTFFQEAMDKGEIRQMPNEMLMAYFFAPISSLAKQVIAGHSEKSEALEEMAIENTWRAMKG